MANLLCLLFGHQKVLVPFSSNRFYCRRCGLDFGVTVDPVSVATPKALALPPVTVKRELPASSTAERLRLPTLIHGPSQPMANRPAEH
jgi:hypothetical protein